MTSELEQYSLRSARLDRHQQDPPIKSTSFSHHNASSVVQDLNNRASVQASLGNFPEANRLYHHALQILMQMEQGIMPVTNKKKLSVSMEDNDITMQDNYENDYDLEQSESGSTQHMLFPKSQLYRMSKSSKLRTASYCGQGVNKSSENWMFHQVYSLPIVMEDSKWERVPTEVHSFVLIFNSALCSHLRGMKLLSQNFYHTIVWECFETARNLYELAFNALSDAHSKRQISILLLRGFDKICFPAIFNNLSHIYKTLRGPDCYEGQHYDRLLLKTIFWLLSDAKDRENDAESTSSGLGSYDKQETEVMDAFLENVFYLIGAPESVVPAAAA